jgi:hypothetical protein
MVIGGPRTWSSPGSCPVFHLLRLPALGDNAAMQSQPPKAEPPKRKRRWFQFSLRTLLILAVACAVGAGYVGRQYEIVQNRRAFLDDHLNKYGNLIVDSSVAVEVLWIRRVLGDEGVWKLGLDSDSDTNERQRAAALFPEAQIMACGLRRHPEISLDFFTSELIPFPDDAPVTSQP